jgi:hypothetical protein
MAETPRLTPSRRAEQMAQEKRLAEALRENLRRRKEQARARETSDRSRAAPDADKDEPKGADPATGEKRSFAGAAGEIKTPRG